MPVDDVFLSRVTHDLRGELATMVAGTHYLLRYEGGVGETGKQMLERVNGAGQRLRKLLDELELSVWIEAPKALADAITPEAGRLQPLVEAALGRLERSIAQRAVTMETELPDDLPELTGDLELLGMAVELVVDFAVARSPKHAVRVVAAAGGGGAPVLHVEDEGGPVDAAALARIFEPFAERELVPKPEPGARRRERLGLGLAIARGILVAHGGGLGAALTPDGGGIALTCALPGPGCRVAPSV
jgi:two-component system OmpR family sensor kinase